MKIADSKVWKGKMWEHRAKLVIRRISRVWTHIWKSKARENLKFEIKRCNCSRRMRKVQKRKAPKWVAIVCSKIEVQTAIVRISSSPKRYCATIWCLKKSTFFKGLLCNPIRRFSCFRCWPRRTKWLYTTRCALLRKQWTKQINRLIACSPTKIPRPLQGQL